MDLSNMQREVLIAIGQHPTFSKKEIKEYLCSNGISCTTNNVGVAISSLKNYLMILEDPNIGFIESGPGNPTSKIEDKEVKFILTGAGRKKLKSEKNRYKELFCRIKNTIDSGATYAPRHKY